MNEARQRFWNVLESAMADLAGLAGWLESASQTEIEEFQIEFEAAKEELADYSEGIRLDGITTAEDGTEDICAWIVGQGRLVWETACSLKGDLCDYAREYERVESGRSAKGAWNDSGMGERYRGSRSPGTLAYRVYEERFDASLYDAIDDR